MKTSELGRRVESDMARIVDKYKVLAEKAGFEFWCMEYALWPDADKNTIWKCSLGLPITCTLAGQGFATTPHRAYMKALDKAISKTVEV